jgi:hypothetical protein
MAILAGAVSEMSFDTDAAAYITAVETADAATLPTHIKNAINDFVVGAKADGFWSAIKAACFLAGPATLNGALVPLVGPAPTNVSGLFVSGDHNQLTGLKGDGSGKFLLSNRNNNNDPQNNQSLGVYATETGSGTQALIGSGAGTTNGASHMLENTVIGGYTLRSRGGTSLFDNVVMTIAAGFCGISRQADTEFNYRLPSGSGVSAFSSISPDTENIAIFARGSGSRLLSTARISFYWIGESLSLSQIDARLATYMAAIATPTIFPRRRRSRSGGGVL